MLWLSVLMLTPASVAFVACGVTPSRAPLGGNYSAIEAPSRPHQPRAQGVPSAGGNVALNQDAPERRAGAVSALATATPAAVAVADAADTLRYDPFQTGDQIRGEVTFSLAAELSGSSADLRGSNNKLALDTKLHVDMKVLKTSAQSLDELEVTLTPISLHTDFDGHSSDSKQDPPETYDVILSGQSPSIRAQSGAPLEKEGRAILIVLITPLVEFHSRWARSPTLSLTPGWSSKVPLAAPPFMAAPGDTVRVGPLAVRFNGRDRGAGSVPFELSLPIEWTSDLGLLNFDFNGRALLGTRGRPLALDLSGPLTGNAGPSGSRFSLRGTAKFAATLSYP